MLFVLQGKLPRFVMPLGRGIGITLFALLIWHWLLVSLLGYQNENNEQLLQLIHNKNLEITLFTQRQNQITNFETRLRFIANLRDQNLRTAELINEFNQAIPATIQLNHVRRAGNTILVVGTSSSDIELVRFVGNLAKSRLFYQPVITSVVPNHAQAQGRYEFQLAIRVRT